MTSVSPPQSPFDPGYLGGSRSWHSAVLASSHIEGARRSFVRSITFCKERQGVTHEFLIAEVVAVTEKAPSTTVYLKVERMAGNATSSCSPMASSTSLQSAADAAGISLSTNQAYDMVYICARKNEVEQAPYEEGETVLFGVDEFPLAHMACLLLAVSQYHPDYNLIEKNCFWYAKCIFQFAQVEYRGSLKPGTSNAKRGHFNDIPIVPKTLKSDPAMFEDIKQLFNTFKNEAGCLKSSLEVSTAPHVYLSDAGS